MSNDPLDLALDEAARPLRGSSGLARLTAGIAAALLVFAMAAWLARGGVSAPWLVLAVWLIMLSLVSVSLMMARRSIARLGPWHLGEMLEAMGAWRRGALTTVLDGTAADTSVELHAAAALRRAEEVRERAPIALAALIEREVRLTRRALAVALVGGVALVAARPLTGAASDLWDVPGAWHAITAPIDLMAARNQVGVGESVVLNIRAIGRRRATLFTRAPGEAWQATEVALDAQGRAAFTTAPLNADLVARAEAGGHRSAEVRVALRVGAFLGAFTVTAKYPSYLGLENEALPVGGDTLVLPEGTRLALAGRATAALNRVALVGAPGDASLAVDGMSFHGEVVPRASGEWRLQVAPSGGIQLVGEMPVLPLRIVPDSAPVVELPVPGVDTVATPAMRLSLVVSLRDDHGLSAAAVEWRIGQRGVIHRQPLPLSKNSGVRALVPALLDLGSFGLKPGDTVRYAATGTDNAPARHVGRSREYVLRIPAAEEERAAQQQATAQAATAMDSLSKSAKQLQRATEDLAQERSRSDPRAMSDAPKDPLSLDAARKGEAVAHQQEQLVKDADKLAKSVEELRQAAERQGLADSLLASQLNDVRKLLEKAMSPELRDKLTALQQSLKDLDADKTHNALQDLAKAQAQLKDAIEQAKELFKRAALESDLGNMEKEAKELADRQHELTPKLASPDSGKAAAQEEQLARRADSLGAALQRAADKMSAQETRKGMQQASQGAKDAAAKMHDAAQAAKQGEQKQAQQSGDAAEKSMSPVDEKIREQREQMQAQARKEVSQGLERALQETSRLAQREMALAQNFSRGALATQMRIDQGMVEEGAGKVLQQVTELAGKNALVSPQASAALSAARDLMHTAVEAVSTATPDLRQASEASNDAVDALSVAAFHLMSAKDKVDGSQSASGMQEMMQQMQKMAGQQGQMAQQGEGMMQQGQSGMEQLMQMAMQQRALAQQLDRMRAGGMMPGAGEMSREAKDLARTLEAGRLTRETVDRQQKLFKKMLDAGRTLQGEEDDQNKERQSTTGKDDAAHIPALLDPRLKSGQGDIRLPSWETLQRLSPEDRRRVIDYFHRLTDGGGYQ